MTMQMPLNGLYAITNHSDSNDIGVVNQVEQALLGGARIIQYRSKNKKQAQQIAEAGALRPLCKKYQATLIINDDITLALRVGADGVHLGKDDPDIATARAELGPDAIIGVSCYNSLKRALDAQAQGCDYVAFGRFYPSQTKPDAVQAELQLLHRARVLLQIPIVAIGGITPDNGAPLIDAGADMLAAIHAVFGQPDIQAACLQFKTLFKPKRAPQS